MKLHHTTYHDDDSGSGTVQVWAGSARELDSMMRAIKANEPKNFDEGKRTIINVPTTKRALIDFLNKYAETF